MAGTLVSSNTTIKINAATAISVNTGVGFTGTVTAYTCPAGCYAYFYLYSATVPGGSSSIVIAGQTVIPAAGTYATPNPVTANYTPPMFVLTPGQTIQCTDSTAGATLLLAGNIIEFINTP